MEMIKNIFSFFKKIFNKKQEPKMIDTPIQPIKQEDNTDFINSLKANLTQKYNKKQKVEVNLCVGDGLGIQTKISY